MKVIICGRRTMCPISVVEDAIFWAPFGPITEVVSGCTPGVGWRGEQWAAANGIPVKRLPSQWRIMVDYADAAILIDDDELPGTLSHHVRERGLPLHRVTTDGRVLG